MYIHIYVENCSFLVYTLTLSFSCEQISTVHCPHTLCEDNTQFKCKVVNYKCQCPSCESASAAQCRRTRYI